MTKLTKQNVGGTDYSVVGCALSATCASAAADYVKTAALTDGDSISDGMSVVITFTNGNSAGTAPSSITLYSSDQINYFSDSGLTQPYTLAPSGCYTLEYTGTGNAYTYQSFISLSVGGVTAPLCAPNGKPAGGSLWKAGTQVLVLYTGGKFLILNVAVDRIDVIESGFPVAGRAIAYMNKLHVSMNYSSEARDVFAIIDALPSDETAYLLEIGGENITNAPNGTSANDFDYFVIRNSVPWLTVIAYDVRSKAMYRTAKINNVWQSWSLLSGENQTLSCTVVHSGTIYKAVRNGNVVMVYLHSESVPVSANYRTELLSGLPAPANGIVPTGIIDWAGIAINANVEINSGHVYVVGNFNTPAYPDTTTITVDSVVTYICA